MLDTIFSITALVGGTVLGFQFVLMLFGFGDDGGGVAGDHSAALGGHGGDMSGGMHGDVTGGADVHAIGHDVPGHDVAGHDVSHSGTHWFYEVISIRTVSAALAFFGIAGKTALASGYSQPQAFLAGGMAGVAALYGVYWLFKQVFRLQHSGNENVRNAIGLPATVYVPIPGKRAGAGKVTFRLQGRLVEYQAVTEDERRLSTGEPVVVVDLVNSDTVCVARTAAPVAT
jgi:hypothetical protein